MKKVYLLITSALLLCSSTLWAATNVATVTIDGESTSYTKMSSAVNEWKAATAATLKLETDVTYTSVISITAGKTLVLDLNGKALTMNNAKQTSISDASSSLTIKNGTLTVNNTYAAKVARGIYLSSSASLNMEDVVYVFNSDAEGDFAKYGINNSAPTCSVRLNNTSVSASSSTGSTYGLYSKGEVSAEDGSTISSSSIAGIAYGLYLYRSANATVSGSTVSASASQNAAYGIYSAGTSIITNESAVSASTTTGDVYGLYATLTSSISKSAVSAVTGTGKAYGVYTGKSCNLSLDNPSISASVSTSGNAYGFYANKAITITNGTYASNNYCAVYNTIYIEGGMFDGYVLTYSGGITGGVFTEVPTAACVADDKMAQYNAQTGYYEVVDNDVVVATVGGVDYTNLREALYASSEETPAILSRDLTRNNAVALDEPHDIYLDLNGKTISGSNTVFSVTNCKLNVVGAGKVSVSSTNAVVNLYGSVDSSKQNYSVLNMGSDVIFEAPNGWGVAIFSEDYPSGQSRDKAFGAVANINGTINASSGVTINGYVAQTNGNVPMININDEAILNCDNDMACVYAGGYGIWNIGKATLTAGTPVYAKSGQVNILGTTINATGAKAEPQPNNNGFYSTGDAILMDTNNSYPGAVVVTVADNAKIESENGYAIQEAITNGTTSSAVGLVVTGEETLLEGGFGAMQMTPQFREAMKDGSSETYQWVLNGVSGGIYSSVPSIVADGYVAQEETIGGETYYKVVPAPESPVAPASQTTYIVNDTKWDYSMDITNSSAIVVKSGNTLEIKGLKVTRADDADASKVTVESGAKLIVGSEGIQTNNAEGLELLSGENGMGMLLYDGSTTATSPLGTANLYVYSKNIEGGDRIWQHFGIPTQATPAITKAVPASFNNWDVKKGWVWDGGSATLTAPWVGHNLSVNSDEPGQIIKFAGQLVGKEDATLTLDKYGYNAFANSYTAPVNLKSIIDGALAIDACTDGAVWVYSAAKAVSTGIAKFDSYGADTSEKDSLASMQAFFILHESNSADNIELSYNEAVLGQNTRGADASSYNKATFTVTANGEADDFKIYEGEQFSSTSIDRGYDIKQMNHGFIKIFAKQNDENYASVATDDAEGVELYIETKQAGEYKLSFSNISEGYEISLTDIVTGTEVEVAEDKVYTFTVDENTTVKRFRFGKSQVSAEEANADAVKIWANDGAIFVANNAAEANIEIINLSGVVVATAAANGEAVQAVPVAGLASGVYVVRVGAATAKVVK